MPLRVMVVDDDVQALKLVRALIEPLGMEVVTFSDSREASENLTRQKFDGLFVDAQMPKLDGFGLARLARSSPSNNKVPLVMITGNDDAATMRKAYDAGITFFLGKPFSLAKMRGLLTALRDTMLKEKRRYARLPMKTTVQCRPNGETLTSTSINVSERGMLLEPSGGLQIASEISLQFEIPSGSTILKPRARIVRKEAPDHMGIHFITLRRSELEAMQRYIAGSVNE